jgi:hypothetical protein
MCMACGQERAWGELSVAVMRRSRRRSRGGKIGSRRTPVRDLDTTLLAGSAQIGS